MVSRAVPKAPSRNEFMAEAVGPPTSGRSRMEEWMESLTVISGLHLVRGRWLVVPHGTLAWTAAQRAETSEFAFDVYDVRTGAKLPEDVPLPPGSRVLMGGRFLHVLVTEPPDPWIVERYRFGEVEGLEEA